MRIQDISKSLRDFEKECPEIVSSWDKFLHFKTHCSKSVIEVRRMEIIVFIGKNKKLFQLVVRHLVEDCLDPITNLADSELIDEEFLVISDSLLNDLMATCKKWMHLFDPPSDEFGETKISMCG